MVAKLTLPVSIEPSIKNKDIESEAVIREQLENLAIVLKKNSQELPDNISETIEKSFKLADQLRANDILLLLNLRWGHHLVKFERHNEAISFLRQGLRLAIEQRDDMRMVAANTNLGICYAQTSKLNQALHHFSQVLAIEGENTNYASLTNIGVTFFQLKKYQKAFDYYQKALERARKNEPHYLPNAYLNIGAALPHMGKYDEAVEYYERSLKLMWEQPKNELLFATCLENIGRIKLAKKEYDKSFSYLYQALVIHRRAEHFQRKAACLTAIARIYIARMEYNDAYAFLQEALSIAVKHSYLEEHRQVLEVLIAYCKDVHKLEDCIKYQDKLIRLQSQYFYPQKKERIEATLNKKEEEISLLIDKNLQIERQNQKLLQYNKELEQYAFIIAHDLKEPLCNISAFVSLLNAEYIEQLDKDILEFLKYIEAGTHSMHKLLEDLLKYSTLKLNDTKITSINTFDATQKVLRQFEEEIKTQKAIIDVQELPNLQIESKHFQWIITQLLENALKFKHPHKTCKIQIYSIEKHDKTYIEVSDNGIGIEEKHQQKIFRIFQRLNKQDYEGTGIGLAICKKIVELYGGEIGLQSEFNEGTKVYFYLPHETLQK